MPVFQNDPVESKTNSTSAAVTAENTNTTPQAGVGIHGKSAAAGVLGESTTWHGVAGITQGKNGGAGVFGAGETAGAGVIGTSKTWVGVFGETFGSQNGPAGVWADGHTGGSGVKGHTSCPGAFGVAGFHLTNQGPGIFGKGSPAGMFEGDVKVTGILQCEHDFACKGNMRFEQDVECKGNILMAKTGDIKLSNADCAEDFDVSGAIPVEPGTVMVLGREGALFESRQAYDKRVAGVISGAGNYKPGIVLDKQDTEGNRQPIALIGKAYCKVDAQFGSVEVGDLLTTSPTPGHAMKASDPLMAFGAIIGKALRPLPGGQGLVPILIALQ